MIKNRPLSVWITYLLEKIRHSKCTGVLGPVEVNKKSIAATDATGDFNPQCPTKLQLLVIHLESN